MPDESSEPVTTTDEMLQASPLLQRLDRRRTQPIGLINTRHFQTDSSRLPPAITQRFALLEQLQTRYGIRESGTATNTELSLASPSQKAGGEQTHTFTSQTPLTPTITATTNSIGQPLSPQLFRVSRKAISLSTHSALPLPLITDESESHAENTKTTVQRLSAGIIPKQISNQAVESSVSNSALVSNSEGLPVVRARVISNSLNTSPAAGTNAPSVLQKAVDTSPARTLDSTMESTRVSTGALATQLGFTESFSRVQARTIPLVIQQQPAAALIRNEMLTVPVSNHPHEHPPVVAPEIAGSRASQAQSVVQRQPAAALIRNKMLTVPVATRPHEHPLPIAPEIPSSRTAPAQSTMVWRKSIDGVTANHNSINHALPLAVLPVHHNGPWIARQATAAPASRTMPMAPGRTSNPVVRSPLPTAGATSVVASEINVAQLAEQVSRILCRQLTVERERRGIRK